MPENNTHLENIKVQGFKSIKKLDLKMEPINILIGANGSGKSNFISLFTFLRNLSEGKLQNYVAKQGFANTFFHFGSKKTSEIVIDVSLVINGYHATFEHGASDDALVFKDEFCTITSNNTKYQMKGVKGESGILPATESDSMGVPHFTRKYMEQCRVYHFHDTGETAKFKNASSLSASDYLYSDAENLASFLYRLKNEKKASYKKSYALIVEAVRTVAPYFHDFYLEPRKSNGEEKVLLKWLHRNHEDPFSAHQLSDGTARFICMATLFLQPASLKPKSIILDEPELGLHPAALEILAEIVKATSKTNQVICSTQSVTFANQFGAKDFIVVDQLDGESIFKRVEEEDLKEWLEEYSMGDIWTKNIIGGRPEW